MSGWKSISTAPIDHDVQLWVTDRFGARALTFPCRLTNGSWVNSELNVTLAKTIRPTYWRDWPAGGMLSHDPPHPPPGSG